MIPRGSHRFCTTDSTVLAVLPLAGSSLSECPSEMSFTDVVWRVASDIISCSVSLIAKGNLPLLAFVPLLHFATVIYDVTETQLFPGVFPGAERGMRYWAMHTE